MFLFSASTTSRFLAVSLDLVLTNLISTAIIAGIVYLFILVVKALRKYLRSGEVRKEKAQVCKSLGDALKGHRIRCKMTQEFVAERLGVSRQAVSKWENGASDPSTSNLLALARLYGISAEELLKAAGTSD
ncbi:MAG: helix-turn-helix transcriptional regulator [Faecousia sp.]